MNAQIEAGSEAFESLIKALDEQSLADFSAATDEEIDSDGDLRNYSKIADLVEASLRSHVFEATPAHRLAFLKRLGHLLVRHAEDYSSLGLPGANAVDEASVAA